MAGTFGPAQDRTAVEWSGTKAGIALRSDPRTGSWHRDGELVAVIEGYPRWTSPALTAIAGDSGHAAALVEAYRRHGDECLDHLRGHFALAVIEPASGDGILAIDRFGVGTLCYADPAGGPVVFGTTTDSVRAHPTIGASITPQTIYNFLYFYDRVCAPETIYREQRKLRPGECLLIRAGACRTRQYWTMPYRDNNLSNRDDTTEALLEHLRRAVRRCIEGENQTELGAFLSGGLDSSTVLSLLAESLSERPRAFTVGFRDAAFDETPYAQIAARAVGADHAVEYLEPAAAFDILTSVTDAYDEPFSNSSALPTYYCARHAASRGVATIFAGDGGDELFSGNARYLKDRMFEHYRFVPEPLRRHILEPIARRRPFAEWFPVSRKICNYVRAASCTVPVRMTNYNVYITVPGAELFTAEGWNAINEDVPRNFVNEIFEGTPGCAKLHAMMNMDLRITLADGDLRKVGRMCAHAGTRVRYPFLDDDLAEFSAQIPPDWLNEGGKIRHFYKRAVRDLLPPEILTKRKKGFGMPMFDFVDGYPPMKQFFCDYLVAAKSRGLFRPKFLDYLVSRLRDGHPDTNRGVIWDIALLERWLESRAPDLSIR